ncbi:MAG: BMP family ABC transporter substrate-binding protein [Ruminococcus sp.]|nr:BMP family ABC transporter substrate-binding protein [Ruminococcus sp.]
MPEAYYKDAQKLAQKEYRAYMSKGWSPTLPALDDFLDPSMTAGEIPLGLIEIPIEKIIGTKTRGRVNAFAPNFMPILEEGTEFAVKWQKLCQAHVTEGIRDPITAYEYMNRYYVMEGNKRVSVLKFFDALNIVGSVTRILPKRTGDEEIELYYEYVDFYKNTKVNFIEFSKRGSYLMLQKLLGKAADEEWSEDERKEFSATYYYFKRAYIQNGGDKLQTTPADAMLSYIKIYGYHELKVTDIVDIKKNLSKMWEEVALQEQETQIEIKLDPADEKKPGLIKNLLSSTPSMLKVAFLYDGSPQKSGWVYAHESGRKQVQRIFEDKIETVAYENVMEDDPFKVIEQAIEEGAKVVFTTSPRLLQASLRAAVEHPDIIIMNCSLNKSHRYIRTYYTRMYEAKFILGAIAGSLTESGRLGYVCDYPIFGQIAGINAFALGAQMANSRAKVYLEWSAIKGAKAAAQTLVDKDIHIISTQDTARFTEDDRSTFGMSYVNKDEVNLLAVAVWKWGIYYEELIRRVLNKTIQAEYENSTMALNYFWGMSAGVVDVRYAAALSPASRRFGDFLRESMIHNVSTPFLAPLRIQNGEIVGEKQKELTQEQIINMDYLVENVIGSIPVYEELTPMGKATVDMAGVEKSQSTAPAETEKAPSNDEGSEEK